MPDTLDRFRSAQADPSSGHAAALAEIRTGRKTGHWIWYVFPQLCGLGRSSTAQHYGIADAAEAAAYLRDPVLGPRLSEIAKALDVHVNAERAPKRFEQVLGEIDAMKVVSSVTLFSIVARDLDASTVSWIGTFRTTAARLLAAAARDGRPPCAFTERRLADAAT